MLERYLTAKDLKIFSQGGAEKTWSVLKEIKEALEIERSSNNYPNSISVSSEDCNMSAIKLNRILKEFQKQKILKILKIKKDTKDSNTISISVKVNRKEFDSEYGRFEDISEEPNLRKPDKESGTNLLISRNNNGDFYYKNKPIKFNNKNAIYYLIFQCLYEKEDLNGFCSYETINRYLEKYGKDEDDNDQQRRDRIKNGLVDLFRFSDLSNKTPDGKPLIKKERGKGLTFYNPQI